VPVVPQTVRRKAQLVGAQQWLDDLPALIAELQDEWAISVGRSFEGATEAFVAEATTQAGEAAVLKLIVPRDETAADHEITVLRLAGGEGCARLLRADGDRGALLLERLGRPLHEVQAPIERRHAILCDVAARVWRPSPDCGLPTGADKGRWLIDFISTNWETLGRPCSERTVEHALQCAARRIEAHDDERAVLVHGDVHQWNALQSGAGFALVDPDGLLAEPEYDLGIIMREDAVELMRDGPHLRARRLAARTGCDPTAVWEWGVVERVSSGLFATMVGLQPFGHQMVRAAEAIAADWQDFDAATPGGGRESSAPTARRLSTRRSRFRQY
jgi:streptomycin 6-kinase